MSERSDNINTESRRGAGPSGPSGPEAEIRSAKATADKNPKCPKEGGTLPKVTSIGHLRSKYKLAAGVQVRDENFGLLFYNYRGPRLYFVPTKDIIDAEFFSGRQSVKDLIESISSRKGWTGIDICKRITMILDKLAEKGLIYEQSIC